MAGSRDCRDVLGNIRGVWMQWGPDMHVHGGGSTPARARGRLCAILFGRRRGSALPGLLRARAAGCQQPATPAPRVAQAPSPPLPAVVVEKPVTRPASPPAKPRGECPAAAGKEDRSRSPPRRGVRSGAGTGTGNAAGQAGGTAGVPARGPTAYAVPDATTGTKTDTPIMVTPLSV